VLFSPAPVQFCAVHLFTWCAGIAGGDDRVVFVNNDRAEISPQAGALVRAPEGEVKEILVPVRPHDKII
jgi:hypothetical protein